MITKLAPAKINLFLHVVGKNKKNYHELESLVTFASFGDLITVEKSNKYDLKITGKFSDTISKQDNIITQAVQKICDLENIEPDFQITLDKNIPVGAGLGGGSSNAAATIHALIELLDLRILQSKLNHILIKLGADVPMCFAQQTSMARGIGEKLHSMSIPHNIPAILIFPHKHCSTADIFSKYNENYTKNTPYDSKDLNQNDLELLLQNTKNDLTNPAIENIPVIRDALSVIDNTNNCYLSRMTGSGSCCFGLYNDIKSAQEAIYSIQETHPDWWIKLTTLNPKK